MGRPTPSRPKRRQATSHDHVVRAERAEKDRELLAEKQLDAEDSGGAEETVPVSALTVGYLRSVAVRGSLNFGLGADVTFYGVPSSLHRGVRSAPRLDPRVRAAALGTRPHGAHAHGGMH